MREQSITATGRIKWGYAFNQWRMGWQGFARVDDNVRALKITSGAGFRCIELTAGTGPWDPLGRPESIAMNFGSVRKFAAQLGDWGIDRITGVFLDPGQMSFEEGHFGLKCTARADHAVILAQAGVHARFVAEVGGSYLVIQPIPSFGKEGALTPAALEAAAELINTLGEANKSLGLSTFLHIDALSALRSTEELQRLLALCPAPHIALALDTAELTIAGHDLVALYRRFHARVGHFHFKDALAIDSLDEYKLPNAERAMILAGGSREIPRWFGELGTGLVDFKSLMAAMKELNYEGWIIVESDKGPQPVASSVLLNSWYVQNVLNK
ncbi:MAG TPA: TIM barrel protein [Steroidobacteraceae bacterium]|nr:TIM barrel protein [Steroidobacteraceae bacterium]